MIRQDYILRLIEEAGVALAKLLGLRKERKIEESQDLIDRCYSGYFNFDTAFLNGVNSKDLLNWLLNEKELQEPQLKVLSDLLVEEAEVFLLIHDTEKAEDRLIKALLILEYLNQANTNVFSFERVRKMNEIQRKLDELNE